MKLNKISYLLFSYLCLTIGVINAQNPVINSDFPDPTVINVNGKFYAYATNSSVGDLTYNIQVASSEDMKNWKIIGDALPIKPNWANSDFWAPHVLYDVALKKYVLFYSGQPEDKTHGKCMGVAFSDLPEGPFIDKGSPLICGDGILNIDPMAFIDHKTGKRLLYWGSDHQPLKVQELTKDWTAFKSGTKPATVMLPHLEKNYTNLIEGPWIDFHGGFYYLYYSGDNCCGVNANYAVLVARSKSPFGPFVNFGMKNNSGSSAILEKDSNWIAPGHNSVFKDQKGNNYIAYHAIKMTDFQKNNTYTPRVFFIKRLVYKNGWPAVKNE